MVGNNKKDNKIFEQTIPVSSSYDWRLHEVQYEKEPKFTTSIVAHPIKINNKETGLLTPNPTALFLNLSYNQYIKACKAYDFNKLINLDSVIEASDYFNSLELYMGSIIFAYTSIESFANEIIPQDYLYEKHRSKCTEVYIKDQIEYLRLDEKLKNILPEILNIPPIAHNLLWNDYIKLRDIRHQIIHIKTKDLNYIKSKNKFNHLWNRIINNGNFIDFSKKAKLIIEYHLKDGNKPRWLKMCPF